MTDTSLVFEPHGGYGTKIDGEPMPFGYISGGQPRLPIFELNPLLKINPEILRKYAVQMAASDRMLAAIKHIVHEIEHSEAVDILGKDEVDNLHAVIAEAEGR